MKSNEEKMGAVNPEKEPAMMCIHCGFSTTDLSFKRNCPMRPRGGCVFKTVSILKGGRVDHRAGGGCGKPGHVSSPGDPSEGEGATIYCQTCEQEAREVAGQHACGHVPARPDVDLTICWLCGEEIIPDPDTHLWRDLTAAERLVKLETIRQCRDLFFVLHQSEYTRTLWEKIETKLAPSIRLAENAFGRWIIVNGRDESLAWSGSRWVPQRNGFPEGDVQICNFEDRAEADVYAKEHFPTGGK